MKVKIQRGLVIVSALSLAGSVYRFSRKRDAATTLGVVIGALIVTRAVVELKGMAAGASALADAQEKFED